MVVDRPPPLVDRRFLVLVAASVALHGALLAWVQGPARERPLASTLITATLRLVAPAMSAAVAVAPAERTPAAAQPEARQLPPSRGHRPVREMVGAAAPQARSATPAEAPVQPSASVPAPASAAMPAAAAPAVAAAAEAPAAPARPQASLLDAYGRHLAELFARQQEYPRVAALRGWEGEVRLRLKVARKGNLLAVNLDRSSGFDVLDQHALAMLAAFGALPPLPEGVEANEIQVVVPVNYKLKKTT